MKANNIGGGGAGKVRRGVATLPRCNEHSPQELYSDASSFKRFFAVVSKPISTGVEGKTARRVLLFDDHPESLRLALKVADEFDAEDKISRRREERRSIICAFIVIAVLVAAMLSPLWT
jgi:hypothetical protein